MYEFDDSNEINDMRQTIAHPRLRTLRLTIEDKLCGNHFQKLIYVGQKKIGMIFSFGDGWLIDGDEKFNTKDSVEAIAYLMQEEGYI